MQWQQRSGLLLMIGAQPVLARLFLNSLEFLLHAREECILQDGIQMQVALGVEGVISGFIEANITPSTPRHPLARQRLLTSFRGCLSFLSRTPLHDCFNILIRNVNHQVLKGRIGSHNPSR